MRTGALVLALSAMLASTACSTTPHEPGAAPTPERVARAAARENVCRTAGTQTVALDGPKCRSKSAARLERARASQILSGARTGYGGSW